MVTISVAITTYCGIRHLAQQLDSIAGQLRAPDQVIICDDASDDGTWAIVKAWSNVVPFRVVTHCQQSNVGLRRNVETALRLCDRDVIVLADQDDIWSPEKLAVVETAFTDPDVTLWFSDADLIDDAGRLIGRRAWEAVTLDERARHAIEAGSVRRLVHGQTVTGATMGVRASVLEAALPLPVNMDNGSSALFLHDGWLAVVASTYGRAVADPRPLTFYRQHAGQVTGMSMVSGNTVGPPGTPLEIDANRACAVAAVAGPNAAGDDVRTMAAFLTARLGSRRAAARHLLRGDYHRYGRGLITAGKDLILGGARGCGASLKTRGTERV